MPTIDTTFTSDDKQIIAAYQRQQKELDRLKAKMNEVGAAGGRAGNLQAKLINRQTSQLFRLASTYIGVTGVISGLTSAYQEQKQIVEELADAANRYQAAVSRIGVRGGISAASADKIAGGLDATPENATKAIEAVLSQGPVKGGEQRLAQLAGLAVDARRMGADPETAGKMLGALDKLNQGQASDDALRNQFAMAMKQGLDVADVAKFADVDSLSGKQRGERAKLIKELTDPSGQAYAIAQGNYEGTALGASQLAREDVEIRQAKKGRVERLQAQQAQFFAEQFEREYQNAGAAERWLAQGNYAFREFTHRNVAGMDAGEAAAKAYKLTRSAESAADPELNRSLDRVMESSARAMQEASADLKAAAAAMNAPRPTYAPLPDAEKGR